MLEAVKQVPGRERSSRAEPLTDVEVPALLEAVDRVSICRGKKTIRMTSADTTPDDLKGPSGGFRAPMLQVDNALVVGFSRETLENLFGKISS